MHVGIDAAELGHMGCSGTHQKLSVCVAALAVGSVKNRRGCREDLKSKKIKSKISEVQVSFWAKFEDVT